MRMCLQILALATFVLAKQGQDHETSPCGKEWRVFGDQCYHVRGVRATHAHATTICQAHAAHLVSVLSTKENNFLSSLLEGADRVWLGLVAKEDKEEEEGESSWLGKLLGIRTWRWIDGSSLIYTSWAPVHSSTESPLSCVSLETHTALWLPTRCNHLLDFVCKKPCRQCQPQPPATLLAGDAEGLGSGETEEIRPQLSFHMQPEALSLRAEGEVSEEIEATPHAASNPDCEEECGKTFYRFSTTPKTWREARKDCRAGDGRVAGMLGRVAPKLAQRLAELGFLLWVGRRSPHATLMLPRQGQLTTGVRRPSTLPCRVALPFSGRSTTVSCLRRYHYLCEYTHTQDDPPAAPGSVLAPPTNPRPPCASGWFLSGGRCYRAFSTWVTWAAAEETCISHGGHLVSVGGPAEHHALRRLSFGRVVTSPVWIGFRRTEGAVDMFEWVDGTPFDQQGWERGQPDHHLGREWCGAASLPGFALQDAVCLTLMPFVCEADSGMSGNTLPPSASSASTDELCEGDPAWMRLGDHCYRLVGADDLQPWQESQKRCVEEGALLASIHSLEENYWLQGKLLRVGVDAVWVGGQAWKEEYHWLDYTPFNFTNWAPGEPNNVHDQEDCLALYTRRQGYWNDQNCGTPAGRVCKRPLISSLHPQPSTPALPPSPSPGHCLEGWIAAHGGKCYKYFGEQKDFDAARAACRKESPAADLASVHTAAQQAYLTLMAGTGRTGAWLGMRKQQRNFLWVDQTSVTYTAWAEGEPSGAKTTLVTGRRRRRQAEECVELMTHTRAGLWNDMACTQRRAFVCQTPREAELGRLSPSSLPSHLICPTTPNLYVERGDHCYRHVLTPLPWQEAKNTCAREGAHLATVLTKTEAAAVWVAVMEAGLEEAWLGLHQEDEDGMFRWSSGWPLLHASWSPDTNNTSQGSELCVALNATNGHWMARPCLAARPFICHITNGAVGVAGKTVRESCPDGRWLDFDGVSCYLVVKEPKPWHDARYTCLLEGGDLTSITSEAEMTHLTLALHDVTQAVWIGLVRENNGQRWTDGLHLNYTNWNEGEPNGAAGLCTEVYTSTGHWNDVQCSQVRPFVCKHVRS